MRMASFFFIPGPQRAARLLSDQVFPFYEPGDEQDRRKYDAQRPEPEETVKERGHKGCQEGGGNKQEEEQKPPDPFGVQGELQYDTHRHRERRTP